jgi:plasmid replication initiation protein
MNGSDGIVKKSNFFIRKARYKLSFKAQVLLNESLVVRVAPGDDDFERYEFDVNDLYNVLGFGRESYKRKAQRLKAVLKELQRNIIEIKDSHPQHGGEIAIMMSWIESPFFDYDRGVVSLRLSEQLKPFLLVDREFAAYRPIRFKGKGKDYAFRIWEYCVSHRARANYKNYMKGGRYVKVERFSLDEFREYLGIPDNQYTRNSRIKDKILTPARNMINEQTEEYFEFKTLKRGRELTGVELHIFGEKAECEKKTGADDSGSFEAAPDAPPSESGNNAPADRMTALGMLRRIG